MTDFLSDWYDWIKALHVISVIAWMAGIFYLPRLFVYHAEQGGENIHLAKVFETMEYRLLKAIMNPAMISTWLFGMMMVLTPGVIDWSEFWPWAKAVSVVTMTWFHMWLGGRRKDFARGENELTGRRYRIMNEVPTVLMVVIVISVIVRPF